MKMSDFSSKLHECARRAEAENGWAHRGKGELGMLSRDLAKLRLKNNWTELDYLDYAILKLGEYFDSAISVAAPTIDEKTACIFGLFIHSEVKDLEERS